MSKKEKILAELERLEKKNNCGTAELCADHFVVTPEPELTEFEDRVKQLMGSYPTATKENKGSLNYEVRKAAAELLFLAREQFVKDGYVIEKKTFHNTIEKY